MYLHKKIAIRIYFAGNAYEMKHYKLSRVAILLHFKVIMKFFLFKTHVILPFVSIENESFDRSILNTYTLSLVNFMKKS